jgi:Transposase DDE domain
LAREPLRDLCAKTIQFVKNTLTSESFINTHKKSPSDFTRKRSLPFYTTVVFLMNQLRSSLQNELDIFFKQINKTDVPEREVTASALCQARQKLKHQAFVELNHGVSRHFYQCYSYKTWHGLRLLAFDGSTVKIPKSEDCWDYFGKSVPLSWDSHPLARVSQCFDVLNHITLDARIESLSIGERELALTHCDHIGTGDLALLDRGYPAFWLFSLILRKKNAHICARVSANKMALAQQFIASGRKEQILELEAPTHNAKETCLGLNVSPLPIPLRFIRIDLKDTPETEILVTSLLDSTRYPHDLFEDLYHNRWPIEEDYKLLKCRIEIENFTGKSAESVKQDFFARVFMCNFTSIMAFPVHDTINENHQETNLGYKINWTQALAKMRNCGILLFFRKNISFLIDKIHVLFIQNVSAIRNGRKFPRNFTSRSKKYAFSYKPIS